MRVAAIWALCCGESAKRVPCLPAKHPTAIVCVCLFCLLALDSFSLPHFAGRVCLCGTIRHRRILARSKRTLLAVYCETSPHFRPSSSACFCECAASCVKMKRVSFPVCVLILLWSADVSIPFNETDYLLNDALLQLFRLFLVEFEVQ